MEHLLFEKEGHIGTLTINRPKALNALNSAVLRELHEFLSMHRQRQDIRALIVTGSGEKAFIAGADIKEMTALDHIEMLRFAHYGQEVTKLLEEAPFVTIAAVNGYALGGGMEMALACDFIYASENAKLGLPEATLGIIPGFGGTQRLARAVGTRRAKEMVMNGKPIGANEAKEMGIVNHVCSSDDLMATTIAAAEAIVKNPYNAIVHAKAVINHGYSLSMDDALALERNAFGVCAATSDRNEGMAAFVEKRQPEFV